MKPFKRTYIEITNTCNLACEFCPGTLRAAKFMDPQTFDTILSRLGANATHLYFHVLGEPLLHPHLVQLLDIADEHKKLVNLTTNGIFISEKGLQIMGMPALRQVTFSLHSFVPGKQIASVESYLNAIIRFAREASKKHSICLRLLDINAQADNAKGMALIRAIEKGFGLNFSLSEKLIGQTGVEIDNNIFVNLVRRFSWPDLNNPDFGDTGFCLGLREQIAVLVDGTVVPCCLDRNGDIALGNILLQTMDEIVWSKRAQGMVKGFSQRKVTEMLCRRCGYRAKFNKERIGIDSYRK
jgi:radical SAM protein with 4Fe4S-binding SPASM domain